MILSSRTLSVTFIILCVLAAAGCSRRPVISEQKETPSVVEAKSQNYSDSVTIAGGLFIKAPQGWGFVEDASPVQARCVPLGSQSDFPTILIQAEQVSTELTIESIVSGYSRQIAKGVKSPALLGDEAVDLGLKDVSAYVIDYEGTLGNQRIVGRPVILRKDKWLVVITRLAAKADYDRHKPAFDAILKNLSW